MSSSKKNRLLALEQKQRSRKRKAGNRLGKLHKRPMAARHKRGGRVRAQALDQGEPIELTYNETTESYEAGEMSYQPADEDEAEAFDWNEEYEDEDEDEDEAEAFDWDEDNEAEVQAFDVDEEEDAEAFQVEAFEEAEDEDSDAADTNYESGSQAFSTVDDEELPEDLDSDDAPRDYDEPSQAMSDSDFTADLQAIINGEKTYDRDRGGMVDTGYDADEDELATAKSQAPAEEAPEAETNPPPEADTNPHEVFSQMSQHMPHNRMGSSTQLAQAKSQAAEAEAEERPHDVFDRMGRNMSYANAFDLGSISMEQRFEEFDDAIDKEEKKIQARTNAIQKKNGADDQETSAQLALDDAALVDDLDQMHEAMASEDDEDEEDESELEADESRQAMQLAIDAVAYVTKVAAGGAYLHSIDTNTAGKITSVNKIQKLQQNRTRVPTNAQISVDTGNTKDDYIFAQYKGKTGAINRKSIVVLAADPVEAAVVRSDVVFDAKEGISIEKGTDLYPTRNKLAENGRSTIEVTVGKPTLLPVGTELLVDPATHDDDFTPGYDYIWARYTTPENKIKLGAVNRAHVIVPNQEQYPSVKNAKDFGKFINSVWSSPQLKYLYRGFLKQRQNVENLDFLTAVEQITNQDQAQAVVNEFVKTGSTNEINVSGSVRRALINEINNPSPNYADWRLPFGFKPDGATLTQKVSPQEESKSDTLEEPKACKVILQNMQKEFATGQANRPNFTSYRQYASALAKE